MPDKFAKKALAAQEKKAASQLDDLFEKVSITIRTNLRDADVKDINNILNKAFAYYRVPQQLQSILIQSAAGGMEVGWRGALKMTPEVEKWLASTTYGGMTESIRGWIKGAKYGEGVARVMRQSLLQSQSLKKTSKLLLEAGAVPNPGKLPKVLTDLDRETRAIMRGSPAADIRAYERALAEAKRYVLTLAPGDDVLSRVRPAYEKVIAASEKLNESYLDRSVERAIVKKAKYQAERMVRTEKFAAYGQAAIEKAIQDPDIEAVKFTLSSAHSVKDECDALAHQNIYGLGEGVFPLDKAPSLPIHPSGRSYYVNVYDLEGKEPKINASAAKNAKLDTIEVIKPIIPEAVRAALQ